jgi:FtsP/CotA-like multicopper oxidase with cupredoxin domain
LALALTASLLGAWVVNQPLARAANTPQSGVVCTTSTSPNASFTLTAASGMINMPDGNTIFMWSYAPGGGNFQFPGPVLCVNQGDTVTVVLNNSLPEATSLVFPGIDEVQANNTPAQPEFNGPNGSLSSLTRAAAAGGGSVTYRFTASRPGTFLYESGTDSAKQVQMGLYGALIVRPAGHPAWAYTDGGGGAFGEFDPAEEYLLMLSEVDPALHQAVEFGQAYHAAELHPRYWLINGRAFPDTIAPNSAAWLPAQPYSSLVHMTITDPALNPGKLPALLRYLNAGSRPHPFHPHGQNGRLLARDANPLLSPTNTDLSYETYGFSIGPGQTWDQTYQFFNEEGFDPGSNPVPVTIPNLEDLTFKDSDTYYSGSPYIGYRGDLPQGTTSHNECGEYYMVFHSHALFEVANYDAAFGGMLTLQRIDPVQPQQGMVCSH